MKTSICFNALSQLYLVEACDKVRIVLPSLVLIIAKSKPVRPASASMRTTFSPMLLMRSIRKEGC
jgi:hypothetical protein